jgi:hypothetical protein
MRVYGSGTQWCITSDTSGDWENYSKDGSVFYLLLIGKRKYLVQRIGIVSHSIWDEYDEEWSIERINSKPNVKEKIDKAVGMIISKDEYNPICKKLCSEIPITEITGLND